MYGSYCRKYDRDCEWCLGARTKHIAPSLHNENKYENLRLKSQPKKHEKSYGEYHSWKEKRIKKQWQRHIKYRAKEMGNDPTKIENGLA